MEVLFRYCNIHYIACVGSLVYLLSKRVDLWFSVHKLEKFLSNPGKVHFECLVKLLRYIGENNNLGLIYYDKIEYAPLSGLLRQDTINTENQLMGLSDSIWQDFPDTVRSTGAYIFFNKVGPIDHLTDVPDTVPRFSDKIDYNAPFTAVMALAHFRMLNN